MTTGYHIDPLATWLILIIVALIIIVIFIIYRVRRKLFFTNTLANNAYKEKNTNRELDTKVQDSEIINTKKLNFKIQESKILNTKHQYSKDPNTDSLSNLKDVLELDQNNSIIESNPYKLTMEQREKLLYYKFINWIESDKHYLDPDLDLNKAAREIGTNRTYLSKSINSQGSGFSELINKYRIKEAISIFKDDHDTRNELNLQDFALIMGFQSKSVFFNAFQKETGMTPTHFKEFILTYKNQSKIN